MELSLQKLDNEIKEIRCERDKAIQQLARLKQHLLEKVSCSSKVFFICINLQQQCDSIEASVYL